MKLENYTSNCGMKAISGITIQKSIWTKVFYLIKRNSFTPENFNTLTKFILTYPEYLNEIENKPKRDTDKNFLLDILFSLCLPNNKFADIQTVIEGNIGLFTASGGVEANKELAKICKDSSLIFYSEGKRGKSTPYSQTLFNITITYKVFEDLFKPALKLCLSEKDKSILKNAYNQSIVKRDIHCPYLFKEILTKQVNLRTKK